MGAQKTKCHFVILHNCHLQNKRWLQVTEGDSSGEGSDVKGGAGVMKPSSKAGVQSEEQTAADMPSGCPEELCQPLLNLPLTSAGSGFEERREQKNRLGYQGYRLGDRKPNCWVSWHKV